MVRAILDIRLADARQLNIGAFGEQTMDAGAKATVLPNI
jgi:hypothetical protein